MRIHDLQYIPPSFDQKRLSVSGGIMEQVQPNRTLRNIVDDLDRLADRADRLVPTLPADEAHTLTKELCAIRALIDAATNRLEVLQAKYPGQFEATA